MHPRREIVIGACEVAAVAREDLTIGHRPHLLARTPTGGTRLLRASISSGRVTARRAHRAGCEDRIGTRVLMVSASVPLAGPARVHAGDTRLHMETTEATKGAFG